MKNFEDSLGGNTTASTHAAAPLCPINRTTRIQRKPASLLQAIGRPLWHKDLEFRRSGWQRTLLMVLALSAIAYGTWQQDVIRNFGALMDAKAVRIFYMVPDLAVGSLPKSMAELLIWIGIARALFNIVVAWLDMVFHRQITGRPFDWESMINVSLVNGLFSAAALFAVLNQPLRQLLTHYDEFIAKVPTLIDLNGSVALVIAALVGDFCFYWSHRVCHGRRLFWNLGHIHHHRNRNLTQMTCAIEPSWLPLQAAGGLSLLLLPLLSKLFTTDIHQAGLALVVLMVVDTLIDPSHSIVLYWVESRSHLLRALRYVFVTVGIHYMHHSCEVAGPHGTGCNFGARLTVWDRLFGTYVEPPAYLPRTGLFDPQADLCVNPLRYVVLPYLRMGMELRSNPMRHWASILFGSTEYEPPNPVQLSR